MNTAVAEERKQKRVVTMTFEDFLRHLEIREFSQSEVQEYKGKAVRTAKLVRCLSALAVLSLIPLAFIMSPYPGVFPFVCVLAAFELFAIGLDCFNDWFRVGIYVYEAYEMESSSSRGSHALMWDSFSPIPLEVWGLMKDIRDSFRGTQFEVEYFGIDPILWAISGGREYAIAIW